jgi:undecaprenyl-diphosphatase
LDYRLTHSLNHFLAAHDGLADPFELYAKGSEPLFVVALVLLFLLGHRASRRGVVSGGLAAGLGLLVAGVISRVVDRPRPFVAHPGGVHALIQHAHDAGFPSDHATAAFAIATAVWMRSRVWGSILFGLAALIAVDRVGVGVHYPLDVASGAVVGGLAAGVLWLAPIRRRTDALADWAGAIIDAARRRLVALVRRRHARAA